jgi:hypothetical protein
MVRVPIYEGPELQPAPFVQFDAPTVRPMEDIASPQIQQMAEAFSQVSGGAQRMSSVLARQDRDQQATQERKIGKQQEQAQEAQDDLDRAEAIREYNSYRKSVRARMYNDQTGFLFTQGESAYGPGKEALLKDLETYRQEHVGRLKSQISRDLFTQRADADDIATLTQADGHAAEQRNQFVTEQDQALIKGDIEDLQTLYGAADFQDRMQDLPRRIAESKAMRGASKEVVARAQKEAQGMVYSGIVERIQETQPEKAMEILNEADKAGFLPPNFVGRKRSELQNQIDEKKGDAAGYAAWDKSRGSVLSARMDLDRQRRNGDLSPAQYEKGVRAVELQESLQKKSQATIAEEVYNAAINRFNQNPQLTMDSLSEEDARLLRDNNKYDEVALYVNNGHQFIDITAEVKRSEDYLAKAKAGQVSPMSNIEYSNRFRAFMSPQTFATHSNENERLQGGGGRGGGGGGGGGAQDPSKDEFVRVQVLQLLDKTVLSNKTNTRAGVLPKMGDKNTGEDAVKELRFRAVFDPIYTQYITPVPGKEPMTKDAAIAAAYNDVMKMPQIKTGGISMYEWELAPGQKIDAKATTSIDGEDRTIADFSQQEIDSARQAWDQDPSYSMLRMAGKAPGPATLANIAGERRKKISFATQAQRDALGGVITWDVLALKLQQIQPGVTAEWVKEQILGNPDDNSLGVFRDTTHPVREIDIVVSTRNNYDARSGQAGTRQVTYGQLPVYAEPGQGVDGVDTAVGISVAAASRFIQNMRGETFNLYDVEPPKNEFMEFGEAYKITEELLTWAGEVIPWKGSFDQLRADRASTLPMDHFLALVPDDQRKDIVNLAVDALAATTTQELAKGGQSKLSNWNPALRRLIQQLSVPQGEQFLYWNPSQNYGLADNIDAAEFTLQQQQDAETNFQLGTQQRPELTLDVARNMSAFDTDSSRAVQMGQQLRQVGGASSPAPELLRAYQMGQQLRQPMSRTQGLRTTVYDNLRPRDRELVDMLRMVDSVEQSLLEMPEVKIDGYTIPSNRERRSQQIRQAIQGVVDGDARAARKLLGAPMTTENALDDVRASLADNSPQVKAMQIYEDVMRMAAPLLHATWADAPSEPVASNVSIANAPALTRPYQDRVYMGSSAEQASVPLSKFDKKLESELQALIRSNMEVNTFLLGQSGMNYEYDDINMRAQGALGALRRGDSTQAEDVLPEIRKLAVYQQQLAPLVKKIVTNAVDLGSTAAQTAAYERVRSWRRMGGQGKRLPKWLQETLSK